MASQMPDAIGKMLGFGLAAIGGGASLYMAKGAADGLEYHREAQTAWEKAESSKRMAERLEEAIVEGQG